MYVRTSEFDVSVKEIVILCLLLLLVIYSISMFINNWSRNYRDIYQPTFIYSTQEDTGEDSQEEAQFATIVPWDHDEELSRTDSRLSKMSQVVRAKSIVEKNKKDSTVICRLGSDYKSPQKPTKSLSASNIFHKPSPRSRSPNLILLRQSAIHSSSKIKHFYSFEDDFHGSLHIVQTPRISIDDTDSNSSLPLPVYHRPYLKYHKRSNGNTAFSAESDPSKDHSQQDVSCTNSKSNLQICNSREDGGSFSFSDLDPVQEDMEGQEDPDKE